MKSTEDTEYNSSFEERQQEYSISNIINEQLQVAEFQPSKESIQVIKKIKKERKQISDDNKIEFMYMKKKKNKQFITLNIEYPFQSQYIFHLSGHILTEISPKEHNYYQICVRQVQKTEQSYIIYPQNIQYTTNLDQIIYLLENSQDQNSFNASQLLRDYSALIVKQKQICDYIQENIDEDKLLMIQNERSKFKNQFLQEYIESNLKDEYFYVIGNVSQDLFKQSSFLENVRFSKGLFAILGVEQKGIENMLFKHHMLFWMLLPEQRRFNFVHLIKRYLQGTFEKQTARNFKLQTIDSIQLICDLETEYVKIPYPSHLRFEGHPEFHISMDNVNITKFEIPESEIKKIIDKRSQYQDNPLEDFEYAMFSQIFIDKFYQQTPQKIIIQQKKDDQLAKQKASVINYDSKRASYRQINIKQ